MLTLKEQITNIARKAKEASAALSIASRKEKDKALIIIADSLRQAKARVLHANNKDIANAKRSRMPCSLIDRLAVTDERMNDMLNSIQAVIRLPDPAGEAIKMWRRPNGLLIKKVRVPIGVIGIIYESRPNVTLECGALCLKSGNSVILRGGSEAINTNISIYEIIRTALKKSKLPQGSINMLKSTDRQAVDILLGLYDYIDLIIPRGGEALIRKVVAKSKIPVIKHYKGVCHIYVDKYAEIPMAIKVAFNAKVSRPATCNAMETLLVHREIATRFLPDMIEKFKAARVEIRGCPQTLKIAQSSGFAAKDSGIIIKKATEKDYHTEYLDLILSVKVVSGIDEAIRHIARYGSRHSDSIITDNHKLAERFTNEVDSACVYVNTSTRFTDGYQFGLGAEIGISTDKIHARGPMALEELTTYKYIIFGKGQIRKS